MGGAENKAVILKKELLIRELEEMLRQRGALLDDTASVPTAQRLGTQPTPSGGRQDDDTGSDDAGGVYL